MMYFCFHVLPAYCVNDLDTIRDQSVTHLEPLHRSLGGMTYVWSLVIIRPHVLLDVPVLPFTHAVITLGCARLSA